MKTKFTKASKTDRILVTLNLAQLDKLDTYATVSREGIAVGDRVFVVIENVEVPFKVNRVRNGKAVTATTICFPRHKRLPQIGRPVYADVSEVF